MILNSDIKYLSHQQIDQSRWDNCIDKAPNGLIYAYSYYLNIMSPEWDALVLNEYEYVMPLTWKKKFGICYLYQPFLTAQLGIFGPATNSALTDRFIRAIPSKFRLLEISLNSKNNSIEFATLVNNRQNYLLSLHASYYDLESGYTGNTRRNAKKASQAGCTLIKNFDPEKVIQLALQQMKQYGKVASLNTNRFRELYQLLAEKKMAVTYGIESPAQVLLASCVFFYSHRRAYYILVGNHPEGKSIGASHALLDGFIKDHAGLEMVLDFEGSDIPGLAKFYQGFGALPETYPFLQLNRLPYFLKWMK